MKEKQHPDNWKEMQAETNPIAVATLLTDKEREEIREFTAAQRKDKAEADVQFEIFADYPGWTPLEPPVWIANYEKHIEALIVLERA